MAFNGQQTAASSKYAVKLKTILHTLYAPLGALIVLTKVLVFVISVQVFRLGGGGGAEHVATSWTAEKCDDLTTIGRTLNKP